LVTQVSNRFPSLNIFEIGAGTGATTSAVLSALGDAYSSYTFTDISSGFFMAAEERFASEAGRMIFKTFNMEKEPAGQGFVEGSYDVVVAVNVLHVAADVTAMMSNVRRLLKPGGFLIVGELTSTELLFSGMTVGTLPGWWIGAETDRPWGPLLNLHQWDAVLKKTGFGGIDTVTPDISTSLPISVYVAQAIDDQVTLLRNPLAIEVHPVGVRTDALAIIGGTTIPVYKLSRDVSAVLAKRFHRKEFFNTLEEFALSDMATSASVSGSVTVLSLLDLDKPYLEDLTESKFEALKTLWAVSGTLVWVTCGSREDNPYSYMMTGIATTVKTEHPNLNIQLYDLEPTAQNSTGIQPTTAKELGETLLRQLFLHSRSTELDNTLWAAEPQVFVDGGRQLVTRLLPDVEKNKRYNSQRRDVFTTATPSNDILELVGTGGGQDRSLKLQKVSPLRLTASPSAANYRTIRITHSLLQSLAVGAAGFVRICVGIDVNTNEQVLALCDSSESPANIPEQLCIPLLETPAPSALILVAANLIADYILSLTPGGATLLVNEPDEALQFALQARASSRNVTTVFTTAELRQDMGNDLLFLHPNLPQYAIRSMIPPSAAVFLHFTRSSTSDTLTDAISKCLPPRCLRLSEEAVIGHKVDALFRPEVIRDLTDKLQKAWNDIRDIDHLLVDCINLENVTNHSTIGEPLQVLDWTATESVIAKVHPIDSGNLFRPDKTYLFVGMAGELGQSLAGWMIVHGARFVVLTSRTPKVNTKFVDDMKTQYGAVVEAMSLDITSRKSLLSVHNAITTTLPPIGGVINGAMILEDELFARMTYEQYTRVIKPKVLGTQLLDELFYHTSLDFFVVASSIASVIGWTGQSNYSAANEFMTSLVNKRRKRGVAGSAMNIPAVLGVGYAAHSEAFDFDYFQSLGYINISEEDLHCLFAETILSGRPGQAPDVKAQVVMGVNYIPEDLIVKEAHRRDIKFSHFIQREESGSQVQSVKAGVRVKVQLQTAKNQEEAYAIARDGFFAHLKRMLRIAEEEKLEDSVTLVDQGVDSLVAVDIRSWFLKELEVDVPTLKILGGGSIADLIKTALEKVSDQKDETMPGTPESDTLSTSSISGGILEKLSANVEVKVVTITPPSD